LNFDKGNYCQQKMRAFFPAADIHFCKWKYVHPGAPKLISPNKKNISRYGQNDQFFITMSRESIFARSITCPSI
jgi:hypothetical protein